MYRRQNSQIHIQIHRNQRHRDIELQLRVLLVEIGEYDALYHQENENARSVKDQKRNA